MEKYEDFCVSITVTNDVLERFIEEFNGDFKRIALEVANQALPGIEETVYNYLTDEYGEKENGEEV